MQFQLNPINISTSAAFHAWRPACWLKVSGADAPGFLQGQFTNDLRGMASGAAVYGLWLSVKGKVLADSFVLRGAAENEFWIGSYFSKAATIRERLEGYIIADDVTLEDVTSGWAGISVLGTDALAPLGDETSTGFHFRGRRVRGGNMEWVFPVAATESARKHFAETPGVDQGEMLRRRIADAIPAVPADVGPGDLPNEGGLEADAISYTKGCYLGQEVMARLKSMGQVRRRLLRVRGVGAKIPALPAPLFAGNRQVGELRSAVRDCDGGLLGLAMVSLLHVALGTELALAADAAPTLRVIDGP